MLEASGDGAVGWADGGTARRSGCWKLRRSVGSAGPGHGGGHISVLAAGGFQLILWVGSILESAGEFLLGLEP